MSDLSKLTHTREFKGGLKEAIETGIEIDYQCNEEGEEYSIEVFDSQQAMEAVISFLKKYIHPPTP